VAVETATQVPRVKNLIAGEWVDGPGERPVLHKYKGTPLAIAAEADAGVVRQAVDAAVEAARQGPPSPQRRFQILRQVADEIARRREELARDIARESGFTIKDCLNDVDRAVQTMLTSAEEAKRIEGEMVPIEGAPGFEERLAFTIRVPVGVVCAITPFNSPLNTVAHKVGPALAAGNAVVLKPATYTPLAALTLARMLLDAGLPPGFINVVLGPGDPTGEALLADERINFYTFTGSTAVGRRIAQAAGLRRTQLELGNVSATIVCEDANLTRAARQCCRGAFRKAGQVCTSVQRLYVHESVVEPFAAALSEAARQLVVGDPEDPATDVGPMISEKEAMRAEAWIQEAVRGGARVVLGGTREGAIIHPTILTDVPRDARVVCEEIFAPVVSIVPYRDFEEALQWVNDSPYGLQAGVFTRSLDRALRAARTLRVGGVVINDTSSTRADLMPYGGVKASGYGKEGPRYAIREMTEERLVLIGPSD